MRGKKKEEEKKRQERRKEKRRKKKMNKKIEYLSLKSDIYTLNFPQQATTIPYINEDLESHPPPFFEAIKWSSSSSNSSVATSMLLICIICLAIA